MKSTFIQYLKKTNPNVAVPLPFKVTFTKADGSTRKMICQVGPDTVITDTLATVWDVEAKDYRSVRYDRITSVTAI